MWDVARNEDGQLMGVFGKKNQCSTTEEAETLVASEGLKLAEEQQWHEVMVELDLKVVCL